MLPDLRTARLCLQPATDADVDALWALFLDADVRRFLWDDVRIARAQAAEAVEAWRAQAAEGLGAWTIHPREGGGLLGCVALVPVGAAAAFEPRLSGLVEPLVALWPAAWGRGYATEALERVLGYALEERGLPRLAAVVDVPNQASHALLARLGFAAVGESEGPRYRLRCYELSPGAFAARPGRAAAGGPGA